MTEWATNRFWTKATVEERDGAHVILLDGRTVKTPAKRELSAPTPALATAIAAEWQAQGDKVDPKTMPMTRSANAAIDKVTHQFDAVAAMIADYGDSDLICYRAHSPVELVARQAAAWDPLIDWSAVELNAPLKPVPGVIHRPQAPESLQAFGARVGSMSVWGLTGLHDMVGISGSLVIGLAAVEGWEIPDQLWLRSRVDELWQSEKWGEDEEAAQAAETKRLAFLDAERFFRLSAC